MRNLDDIEGHVRDSGVLLLLQTKHVLTRPWCLIEVHTAIKHKVPIVPLQLVMQDQSKMYNFDDARDVLENLATRLQPCDQQTLKDQGVTDLQAFGQTILARLPLRISIKFDVSYPDAVRTAMKDNLVMVIRQEMAKGDVERAVPQALGGSGQ